MKYTLNNHRFILTACLVISILVLVLSIRGRIGNLDSSTMQDNLWKDEGPLELSPERGRFALLYSVVEDRSFTYSLPVAKFATPDLGYLNEKYVSLFTPGLSFLLIPGYLAGKYLGISQVGTYSIISFFAFCNLLFIRTISIRLGAHPLAGTLAGLIFLFATPAYSYAVSLYQHHPSTFLVLVSLHALLSWKKMWSLLAVWLAIALAITIDFPNAFFMLPIGLFAVSRFFSFKVKSSRYVFNIHWPYFFTLLAMVPPLLFFLWFNQRSYGNALQLSGTVPTVKFIDDSGRPAAPALETAQNAAGYNRPDLQNKSALTFFNTRFLPNGFYTHFVSLDRGILVYTPIILLSLFGGAILYRRQRTWLLLYISVIGVNILLYSMWGDPYGGWAFGSRYLIPSYALASIFIAVALTRFKKNTVFLIIASLLFMYSAGVNTLGALSSNRNPPRAEVLSLESQSGIEQKYTYERNIDFLKQSGSKSFMYQSYFQPYFSAWHYAVMVMAVLTGTFGVTVVSLYLSNEKPS